MKFKTLAAIAFVLSCMPWQNVVRIKRTGAAAPIFVTASSWDCFAQITPTCSDTFSVTAGNHLFVGISSNGPATLTISDSAGDTFYPVNANLVQSGNVGETFEADNIAGGSTTFTCGTTFGNFAYMCVAVQFSDGQTGSALDQIAAAGDTGASTTASVGPTPTTTQASELVIAFYGSGSGPNSLTAGSGYSFPAGGEGCFSVFYCYAMETMTTSSTGAQSATITKGSAVPGTFQMATFK
jgi:hypothetical protein